MKGLETFSWACTSSTIDGTGNARPSFERSVEPAPAAASTAHVVRVIGTRVQNGLEAFSCTCTSCSIDGTRSERQYKRVQAELCHLGVCVFSLEACTKGAMRYLQTLYVHC